MNCWPRATSTACCTSSTTPARLATGRPWNRWPSARDRLSNGATNSGRPPTTPSTVSPSRHPRPIRHGPSDATPPASASRRWPRSPRRHTGGQTSPTTCQPARCGQSSPTSGWPGARTCRACPSAPTRSDCRSGWPPGNRPATARQSGPMRSRTRCHHPVPSRPRTCRKPVHRWPTPAPRRCATSCAPGRPSRTGRRRLSACGERRPRPWPHSVHPDCGCVGSSPTRRSAG